MSLVDEAARTPAQAALLAVQLLAARPRLPLEAVLWRGVLNQLKKANARPSPLNRKDWATKPRHLGASYLYCILLSKVREYSGSVCTAILWTPGSMHNG